MMKMFIKQKYLSIDKQRFKRTKKREQNYFAPFFCIVKSELGF